MPRLLRSVLSVIEIFYKYTRKDGDGMTMTCRELKHLLQGEFEDILQPYVLHAVEKNVNLLDTGSDGSISFDDFVLAICNLLNHCYLDIQSLNSELKRISKPEKETPDDVDSQTTRSGQQREETPPTKDNVVLPSGMAPSSEVKFEKRGAVKNNEADPREHSKTHKLPGEASEHNDSKNTHVEGDEQEVAQDVQTEVDSGTQLETNKAMTTSEQTSSPTKEEEPEKDADRKSCESEKSTAYVIDGRVCEVQELGKGDADRTLPETKYSAEPDNEGRIAETQEPPAQEKEQETKSLPVQDDINISETHDVKTKRKLGRGHETHEIGQKESEIKTQTSALEVQIQDRKHQELQGPSKEREATKGSETQDLTSEGINQNHREIEKAETPREDVRYTEKDTADILVSSKNAPVLEGALGARERTQEESPLESPSGGEDNIAKTQDKSTKEGDSDQGEDLVPPTTQNEGSSETPKSLPPEEGDRSSETGDLPAQGSTHSQVDTQEESMQGDCNNDSDAQRQAAMSEKHKSQESMVLAVRGESEQRTEEQEQFLREEYKSQGSETKGPGPDVDLNRYPEAQQSTVGGENGQSVEIEIPETLDADNNGQLSVEQQPTKGDGRKQLKVQSSGTEEGRASETQETPLKSLDEDNSTSPETHHETEELATLQEENGSVQELAEGDDQQHSSKKGRYSSVPQSDLEERMQRDQQPCSVKKGSLNPGSLYEYLQEEIPQQTDITQEEHQKQVQSAGALGLEFSTNQSSASLSQALQQHTRELLPDEAPADPEQISAIRTPEEK
ncbi:PREDICTED: trichohyalin-like protein 1 [Chrysochloris asiatica]|uniref:Trichohyalin-like protein 1 n=1 Tax=Chrysochloris asiatica TaxID=185453 RepID=A0A9B0TA58_CHRAS|nr:PREDICTED: trichohyalin-like protein 1 [Chrysochloris asiatica]